MRLLANSCKTVQESLRFATGFQRVLCVVGGKSQLWSPYHPLLHRQGNDNFSMFWHGHDDDIVGPAHGQSRYFLSIIPATTSPIGTTTHAIFLAALPFFPLLDMNLAAWVSGVLCELTLDMVEVGRPDILKLVRGL